MIDVLGMLPRKRIGIVRQRIGGKQTGESGSRWLQNQESFRITSFLALFCSVVLAATWADAALLDSWEWRNPLPQGNTLNAAVYGEGLYVAVGRGIVLTSQDRTSWTARSSGILQELLSVAYGNGVFVAVGSFGTIVTSPDGISWAVKPSGVSQNLHSVTFGSDKFVAVGESGTILTSPNGDAWSKRVSGTTSSLTDTVFGSGKFVTMGGVGEFLDSPDGVTWTKSTAAINTSLQGITYGNGTFVAVGPSGAVATSSDGRTWLNRSSGSTSSLRSVRFAGGVFVAVGVTGTLLTSADGVGWTTRASGTTATLDGVMYGEGNFVAVGSTGEILTSFDAIEWRNLTVGTRKLLRETVYGLNTFVAIGDAGTILTSPDGTDWTLRSAPTTQGLVGITYGSRIFVAVGAAGTILTSPDGINWTAQATPATDHLTGVAYGNGRFVAVGSTSKMTSLDGVSWTRQSQGFQLKGITYGANMFVAVGDRVSTTSPDGLTWTTANFARDVLEHAVFDHGKFVAAGWERAGDFGSNGYGLMYTSLDGLQWTPRYVPTNFKLLSVTALASGFVAVGFRGTVVDSPDGITWTLKPSATNNDLESLSSDSGSIVAVGTRGTIVQSGRSAIAPSINAVSPYVVPVLNGSQTFTIYGSNFAADCSVTLRNLRTGEVFSNHPKVSTISDRIVINTAFGTIAGQWTVEIINPGEISTGQFRFGVGESIPISLTVSPDSSTNFGTVKLGSSSERAFLLTNVGNGSVAGSASTQAPFSIQDGGAYNLAVGQQQTVRVRYTPSGAGTDVDYLTFSGGQGNVVQLFGGAFTETATGALSGNVKAADTGAAIEGATIVVAGQRAQSGFSQPVGRAGQKSSAAGTTATRNTPGQYGLVGLPPGNLSQLEVLSPNPLYSSKIISNVQITAGQTRFQDIFLERVAGTAPTLNPEQVPTVLIRGRGTNVPWGAQEESYWAGIRQALKGNSSGPAFTDVWECNAPELDNGNEFASNVINGEAGIEDNSKRLEKYVVAKATQYKNARGYYPPQLNIVAHSMGGLIARRALAGRDYFSVKDSSTGNITNIKIKKVVMLATPNAGTVAADKAYSPTSLIGQFRWDSTKDHRTSYINGQFNPNHHWSPAIPLYLLAGTNDYITSDFWLSFASTAISLASNPFDYPNDGAVPRPSVEGTYYIKRLVPPPVPNSGWQVVFDPFRTYLGNIKRNFTDQHLGASVDHYTITQNSTVAAWVKQVLTNVATTSMKPVEGAHGPTDILSSATKTQASNSVSSMQRFDSQKGLLQSGEVREFAIVSDAVSFLQFTVLVSDSSVGVRVTDPQGSIAAALQSSSDPDSGAKTSTYEVSAPLTGVWRVRLDGNGMSGNADFAVNASGDSSLTLVSQELSQVALVSGLSVSCSLADVGGNSATPVAGAYVKAHIDVSETGSTIADLVLFDDGLHLDGGANDGFYGALSSNPGTEEYRVIYRASGNFAGKQFQRVGESSVSISADSAKIAGPLSHELIDSDADGAADVVRLKALINCQSAGTFVLSGELVGSSPSLKTAASQTIETPVAGTSAVTLDLPLQDFIAAGNTCPASVQNLKLFKQGVDQSNWLDTYTESYSLTIMSVPSAASPLQITSLLRSATDEFTLRWLSDPTKTYSVLRSPDPGFANYEVIASDIPGCSPSFVDTTLPSGTNAMFYKVRVNP